MEDLCEQLSPEAAKDIMENGYKNGELIYSKLKSSFLRQKMIGKIKGNIKF